MTEPLRLLLATSDDLLNALRDGGPFDLLHFTAWPPNWRKRGDCRFADSPIC